MIVAVDQAGHQQFSGAVDDLPTTALGTCGHRPYLAYGGAAHCDISVLEQVGSGAGEQSRIGDKSICHGRKMEIKNCGSFTQEPLLCVDKSACLMR